MASAYSRRRLQITSVRRELYRQMRSLPLPIVSVAVGRRGNSTTRAATRSGDSLRQSNADVAARLSRRGLRWKRSTRFSTLRDSLSRAAGAEVDQLEAEVGAIWVVIAEKAIHPKPRIVAGTRGRVARSRAQWKTRFHMPDTSGRETAGYRRFTDRFAAAGNALAAVRLRR